MFIAWPERSRQILKKWRTLSPEQKSPFLLKARENRTNLRQKKAQQVSVKTYIKYIMRKISQATYHNGKENHGLAFHFGSFILIIFNRNYYI